jgi:hypothetical protein
LEKRKLRIGEPLHRDRDRRKPGKDRLRRGP